MKYILSIEHPAWVHQFRHIISLIKQNGHSIKILAINKDNDLQLLEKYNIEYDLIGNSTGNNLWEKAYLFIIITIKIFIKCIIHKPDIFIGRPSPMMTLNSYLFRKPHIGFSDTEYSNITLWFAKRFSDVIITPQNYSRELGQKQLRINSFKELFYLHPKYFKADKTVLNELGINEEEKFIIMRFVAFKADHDIGVKGFSIQNKLKAVNTLNKYAKVFISSEVTLPKELEEYKINISPEKLHDAISFATLYIGDSQTTTFEAACLGTPAIRCNSFAKSLKERSNFIQLEQYDLLFNYHVTDQEKAIEKAVYLIQTENIKTIWQEKRDIFLRDKIDANNFFFWLIENYPKSYDMLKNDPDYQEKFK